jgi:ferric-dicitrate binding protein FerR (iron transport regulator)
MDEKRLIEYIKGEVRDKAQKAEILNWIEASADHQKLYNELKNLWVLSGIEHVKQNVTRPFFKTVAAETTHSKRFMKQWLKYAAIAIVSLMLGAALVSIYRLQGVDSMKNQVFAFSAGEHSNSKVTLPDGSVIDLNARSELTFQYDREADERLVTLSGEAYFNVVHNDEVPFIIDFGALKVVDVGTEFNVKANDKADYIETTLVEGLVDLYAHGEPVVNLKPGQQAIFNRTNGTVAVNEVNSESLLGWKKNRFVFKNQEFGVVLSELADWYQVDIHWEDENIQSKRLHYMVQRNIPIEKALDLLRFSIPFDYKLIREGDVVKQVSINKINH